MNTNTIVGASDTFQTVQHKIQPAGHGQKLNVLGDNQTIKLSGRDTGDAFTIVENYNDPGVGIPMHVHENEDEVFLILEGQMEFETQGEISVLSPGDMIFLPRRIPHAFRVVGAQKCRASVTIIPSGIEHMFEALAELPQGPPNLGKVGDICYRYGISFV